MKDITITPIEKAKPFTPYSGIFSKKMYLNKSQNITDIFHDDICFDKKVPDLCLSDKKSISTVGVYEYYSLTNYGFTKKELVDLDKAYLKCVKPNFDWMDVYNFAERMYQLIAIDKRFSSMETRRYGIENKPHINFDIIANSNKNIWNNCDISIFSDRIEVGNRLDYDDRGWNREEWKHKWPGVSSVKDAFAAVFDAYDIGNYDISEASIEIRLFNIPNELDHYGVEEMTTSYMSPISAVKAYKDIYTKAFPKVKYPSLYKFSVKHAFGTSEFKIIDINKDTAYKRFIKQASSYKSPKNKCSYGCNTIWEPCKKEEGEQIW